MSAIKRAVQKRTNVNSAQVVFYLRPKKKTDALKIASFQFHRHFANLVQFL